MEHSELSIRLETKKQDNNMPSKLYRNLKYKQVQKIWKD